MAAGKLPLTQVTWLFARLSDRIFIFLKRSLPV
jgi:hypothetical protein